MTGQDRFSYTIVDGDGGESIGTVTVSIRGVNDAPIARTDYYSVGMNRVLKVNARSGVLSNDSDYDSGDILSVSLRHKPLFGSVDLRSDGRFTYKADCLFGGIDAFVYTVSDSYGARTMGIAIIQGWSWFKPKISKECLVEYISFSIGLKLEAYVKTDMFRFFGEKILRGVLNWESGFEEHCEKMRKHGIGYEYIATVERLDLLSKLSFIQKSLLF